MNKTKIIGFKLEDEVYEWLDSYCNATGRKKSWVMNQAIKDYKEREQAVEEMAKKEG